MEVDTEIDSFHFDSSSCDNITSERRGIALPLLSNSSHVSAICSLGVIFTISLWFGEQKVCSLAVASAIVANPSDCKLQLTGEILFSCFRKISKYKIGMKKSKSLSCIQKRKKKKSSAQLSEYILFTVDSWCFHLFWLF